MADGLSDPAGRCRPLWLFFGAQPTTANDKASRESAKCREGVQDFQISSEGVAAPYCARREPSSSS